MTDLYVLDSAGVAQRLSAVRCRDEERELQDLLQRNPDLLVGDQIDPEDPRRWLLIRREMSVPDPLSGTARWSIDFLYVDQDATPTFVECKRHNDTRSRREVIAQVIDYAANASLLWTKDQLLDAAKSQSMLDGVDLSKRFEKLGASEFETLAGLMEAAVEKLKNHDIRIVLFMENAPAELKTIVEFMNAEMSTVEVLLVEARMYSIGGSTVVSPALWGYTDRVRQRKQAIADATGECRKWDGASFFADLHGRVSDETQRSAVRSLYERLPELGYAFKFGTGSASGSINARLPDRSQLALVTIRSDGTLTAQFGGFSRPELVPLQTELVRVFREAGLSVPDDYAKRYINYRASEWAKLVEPLLRGLAWLAKLQPME
jgi:hypothetical protein